MSFYLNGEISLWGDLFFQSRYTHSLLRIYYFNPLNSWHDVLSIPITVKALKLHLIFGFFVLCSEKRIFFMKRNSYRIVGTLVDTKFNESVFQFARHNLPILSYSFNHMFNSLIINIGLLWNVCLVHKATSTRALCAIWSCRLISVSYLRFKK